MNIHSNNESETTHKQGKNHGFFGALFKQRCPHCRQGHMFKDENPYHLKNLFLMNEKCPVCGQKTELEPGFYYGTAYVSYALTVAFSASTFVAWWVLIGLSTHDNRIFWWMGINGVLMILLQPYFIRLSRSVWLSFFVSYDNHWREDEVR
jgi:hypothetical protein